MRTQSAQIFFKKFSVSSMLPLCSQWFNLKIVFKGTYLEFI